MAAALVMEDQSQTTPTFLLTPVERALLRLLVSGSSLEEAATSLGSIPLGSTHHFEASPGAVRRFQLYPAYRSGDS